MMEDAAEPMRPQAALTTGLIAGRCGTAGNVGSG